MKKSETFQTNLTDAPSGLADHAETGLSLLRLIRAAQPITKADAAERLGTDKKAVTETVKPLIFAKILREESLETLGTARKQRFLSFVDNDDYFIGVNIGVRTTQVGTTTLKGETIEEDDFVTPANAAEALGAVKERIENIIEKNTDKTLRLIGVSVPGVTDTDRRKLVYAPNLNWRDIDIAKALKVDEQTPVVVENDATAAAMYEARLRMRASAGGAENFVLVRSGTGIGVGLVIDGEVYRGSGATRGIAGEFGHMTIVAGGKPCVCGNRGCWEKYASAASAASLYLGDRPLRPNETMPRFVEIVSKAENGEIRSRRTLEKIGEYLGIGIANVIMGVGIPRVVISGRLVYGWNFIKDPLHEAIEKSIVGKLRGWTIEAGEPAGAALGGALEIAAEEYLSKLAEN